MEVMKVMFVGGPRALEPTMMRIARARRRCERGLGERGVYRETGVETIDGEDVMVFRWEPDRSGLTPWKAPEIDGSRD